MKPLAYWNSVLCLLLCLSGCSTAPPAWSRWQRFEFRQPQMGLPFRIVLYAPTTNIAETAAAAAFRRIAQLNDCLSDYDPDSELSRLSRTAGEGRPVKVSEDLWQVLRQAQALAARSAGAFDVTVGPYVIQWRKARREKKLPDPQRLAEAALAVGWKKLQLSPREHTVTLLAPEMRLDLGGIAKGYALDEALKTLRAHGITSALVSGGGDMAASGPPPGEHGWRIEIAPLDITNAPAARFVFLRNAGLATSGDVFQHLEVDGVRYSHIVDPRTGMGLTDHSLVTLIARDGTMADGLATAVSVLGRERGRQLVEATSGAALFWVGLPHGQVETVETRNFRKFCDPSP